MPMKYNRIELADGIGFSTVIDGKFKTNSITVRFITQLDEQNSAANVVGIGALSVSSAKFRTLAALNERMSELYGASLSSGASKRGDLQILSINSSWINNRYALDGEDITAEMLDLVCGCIFEPNVNNGRFDEESFKITKKDLLDHIEAEINDKRGFAISRASETAFEGEGAGFSCYGERETAEKVTSASACSAYRKILETAQIEIFYVAPEENESVGEKLKAEFSKLSRCPAKYEFNVPSPVKQSVERVSDELDVNQCKMVMTFKTDSDDTYAIKLMSMIFGGTPVSKLFMNVREKLSLCYYCACRNIASKSALMVDCGVERGNIEKAEKEIQFQLDEIRNGNFTNEELDSALLSIENALSGVGDTHSSYVSWYFERFCKGRIITPEQQSELYRTVTRERIIEAAKSVKTDSIYIMYNKEAKE